MNDVLKIKCVIYARAQHQGMKASVNYQIKDMEDIAIRENFEVIKVFIDYGSANSTQRKGFKKMIELLSKGKAQVILCTSLDRLTRSFRTFLPIADLVENKNVEIGTLNGRYCRNDINLYSQMMMIKGIYAYHSESTKRGIARARAIKNGKQYEPNK